jgi:hypothetical protein
VSTDARLAAPPTVLVYDPPKTDHSSDGASDQTREALQILNAIFRDKRVVRANQNCSGTLLSSPAAGDLHPISRKNNFRVDLGQYSSVLPTIVHDTHAPAFSATHLGKSASFPTPSCWRRYKIPTVSFHCLSYALLPLTQQPYSPASVTSGSESRWKRTAPKRHVEVRCSPYIDGLP